MFLIEAKIGTEWVSMDVNRLSTARQLARKAGVWVIVYAGYGAVGQIDPRGNWFDLRPMCDVA